MCYQSFTVDLLVVALSQLFLQVAGSKRTSYSIELREGWCSGDVGARSGLGGWCLTWLKHLQEATFCCAGILFDRFVRWLEIGFTVLYSWHCSRSVLINNQSTLAGNYSIRPVACLLVCGNAIKIQMILACDNRSTAGSLVVIWLYPQSNQCLDWTDKSIIKLHLLETILAMLACLWQQQPRFKWHLLVTIVEPTGSLFAI